MTREEFIELVAVFGTACFIHGAKSQGDSEHNYKDRHHEAILDEFDRLTARIAELEAGK